MVCTGLTLCIVAAVAQATHPSPSPVPVPANVVLRLHDDRCLRLKPSGLVSISIDGLSPSVVSLHATLHLNNTSASLMLSLQPGLYALNATSPRCYWLHLLTCSRTCRVGDRAVRVWGAGLARTWWLQGLPWMQKGAVGAPFSWARRWIGSGSSLQMGRIVRFRERRQQ